MRKTSINSIRNGYQQRKNLLNKAKLKSSVQTTFNKFYDLAIKDISQLKIGTSIWGLYNGEAKISSEVFLHNNTLWVQAQFVKDGRYYMISLSTYGINHCGTHNLLFLNKKDYEDYEKNDWVIDTEIEYDYDGTYNAPVFISPEKSHQKRRLLSTTEKLSFQYKDFSVIDGKFK